MLSETLFIFLIITLAEMGDKSQLVCMTLAAKHKTRGVLYGAIAAFLVLNTIAVLVGSAISSSIPTEWVTLVAAILFTGFGLHSLLTKEEDDDVCEEELEKKQKSIFLTSFLLIFVAELGDKTQLAVATMSTTQSSIIVWVGASLALIFTSVIGVYAGQTWLSKINTGLLNRLSGVFFLLVAVSLLYRIMA
ncbi:TMEM165/GDT1 family protein [Vibrio sp.]|nr:TMEM165/GDT1 family protein [Vibrio sp.]